MEWSSYGNTSDYFNVCATYPGVTVPSNGLGYQQPADGQAYCGLFCFYANNYREFIGTTLDSALEIGQRYFVSAKFSLADGSSFCNAVNKLCIRFSVDSFSATSSAPVDNFAQIISGMLITDTAGWYLLKGSFIADTAYNHIIIGNFFDNQQTDTLNLNGNSTSYYFVDAICVSRDSSTCYGTVGISQISRVDPEIRLIQQNDKIILINESGTPLDAFVKINNLLGENILNKEIKILDYEIIPFNKLQSSIYFISILINNKIQTFKLFKQ